MNYSPDTSLEDLIDLWHNTEFWSAIGDTVVTLHEFLRLTQEEYAAYVECRLSDAEVMELYHARA